MDFLECLPAGARVSPSFVSEIETLLEQCVLQDFPSESPNGGQGRGRSRKLFFLEDDCISHMNKLTLSVVL